MNPKSTFVIISPFLIIIVNIITAIIFGNLIGKWAFIPLILIEWILFLFFIIKYGGASSIRNWLKKSGKNWGWNVFAIIIALTPLPIFLKHYQLLDNWSVWLPWILLALINPWLEEFYWRGLLSDFTKKWNSAL
ncbi:MAG: hypothetical protein E2590_02225 [Chryseobacterium sp.]|nr:hypothetical protein [Chryseobacterium sp.]